MSTFDAAVVAAITVCFVTFALVLGMGPNPGPAESDPANRGVIAEPAGAEAVPLGPPFVLVTQTATECFCWPASR